MIRFINGRLVLLLGFLFCCNVLSSAGSAVYAEDASIVRASQVDGSVTVNGKPLKDGDIIQRDDRIATKEKSVAILTWSNGSMVEIYPETTLVLRGVTFEGDNKLEKTLLTLERGRIFAKAQTPEHIFSHFEISVGNTPV
ncbi:MAG: FecR domain-containing protein, partial [Nitrospirota bacterium]|nr:FecR domain-containing protein [Nitrospirota bacterium]